MVKKAFKNIPDTLGGFIIEHEYKKYIFKNPKSKNLPMQINEETIALEGFLIKLIKNS